MAVNKNKIVAVAQKYTAKGQFDKAIAEYHKLLKEDPDDIRTWLKIGDLYTRKGSRKEATETYLRVADQYTKNGFHLKAVAVYKQVLKLDPTIIGVHGHLAESYLNLGLTSEALIQLEQLADMYLRTGRVSEMLQVLVKMVEIDQHNIATRLRIAEYLSKEDRIPEAVENFLAACKELKNQGRIDDFLKVAERLLYHDSSHVEIARETARLYIEQNQFKRALSKLQLCFVKDPRDLPTLELLSEAFRGLDQPDKASSVLKEMVLILAERGDKAEQQRILEKIRQTTPAERVSLEPSIPPPAPTESPESLPSPAAAVSEPPVSEHPVEEELSIEQIEERSRKMLVEAGVLIKYGLLDRASDHLRGVFKYDPFNIDARELYKDVLVSAGDIDGALEQLFYLVDLFKDSQPEGAVYYLHEVIRIDKGNSKARQMISDLGGIMPEDLGDSEVPGEPVEMEEEIFVIDDDEFSEPGPTHEDSTKPSVQMRVEPQEQVDTAVSAIDDIPYVPPSEEAPDQDALGGDEVPDDNLAYELDMDMDADDLGDLGFEAKKVSAPPKPPAVKKSNLPRPSFRPPASASLRQPSKAPPIPVPSRVAPPPVEDIEEELEELDFFISSELFEEASSMVSELLQQHPTESRLLEADKVIKAGLASEEQEEEVVSTERPSFDPGSLVDDLGIEEITHDAGVNELDAVFSQFKAGVEKQVSSNDFATHYDLGIAYKEMGLFDDALAEFGIAAGDPERRTMTTLMIGMCHMGTGSMEKAVEVFLGALDDTSLSKDQELGLLYELGNTYQAMGQGDNAASTYNKIIAKDESFADVKSRLADLSSGGSSGRQSVF